jgi:hypothetical protein
MAAASSLLSNNSQHVCQNSDSANVLCRSAVEIKASTIAALEASDASSSCLSSWALRVCSDARYEGYWYVFAAAQSAALLLKQVLLVQILSKFYFASECLI